MSDIEKLKQDLLSTLSDFSADYPPSTDFWGFEYTRLDDRKFPVPGLLYFVFSLLQYDEGPLEDKIRWSIYCSFMSTPISFELGRIGLRLGCPVGQRVDLKRLVAVLYRAVGIVEARLKPFAEEQVDAGNLTVENRYSEFDRRYRFHRKLADDSFEKTLTFPNADDNNIEKFISQKLNHIHRCNKEGFFCSLAMIDAFFSRLEHQLLLLRAFAGKPLARGEFLQFIQTNWKKRLGDAIGTQTRDAQRVLGEMDNLKQRIRNPFAHGGIENDGGAFHIHFPRVGAIPANFSRFRNSARSRPTPISHEEHVRICVLLDEVDLLLSSGTLAPSHRIVCEGVDAQFDAESLARYASAIGDDGKLEAFLNDWSAEYMRFVNIEWT